MSDASLEFGVQPVVGVFIQQQHAFQQQLQQQFQQLQQNLQQQQHAFHQQIQEHSAKVEVMILNTRLMGRNRRNVRSGPLLPLQKYVSFSSLNTIHAEFKLFPRLKAMAMIWHMPYVGKQISPMKHRFINLMQWLVMCRIHGTQV